MRRDEALARLKRLEPDLRRQGLSALYLFGSVARDEATEESDVDVAFDVPEDVIFDLFQQVRIQQQLSKEFRAEVDFVLRDELRPRIRAHVEGDMVQVF